MPTAPYPKNAVAALTLLDCAPPPSTPGTACLANIGGIIYLSVNGGDYFALGTYGSDVSVPLGNGAVPSVDVTAFHQVISLLTLTPGSERSQLLIQLLRAGVPPVDALALTADKLTIPAGVGVDPSLAMFGDLTTGWISGGAGTWTWRSLGNLGMFLGGPGEFGMRLSMRFNPSRGVNFATGATVTMPSNSNISHGTGNTQTDFMTTTSFSDGAPVWIVWDSAVTVRHMTAAPPANTAPFFLSGAVNAAYGAGAKCVYILDLSGGAPGVWREWSRLA